MNIQKMKPHTEYEYVSLYPGELCIAETPTVIWTVVGSCVAIVFHHRASGRGAICHAQLPEIYCMPNKCSDLCPDQCQAEVSGENPFKFVSCSIRYLASYFAEKGISPYDIDVKIFGGANLLVSSQSKTIGDMNLERAEKMLAECHLHVVSQHVGGAKGRTLYFYSDTGEVFLKQHPSKFSGQE